MKKVGFVLGTAALILLLAWYATTAAEYVRCAREDKAIMQEADRLTKPPIQLITEEAEKTGHLGRGLDCMVFSFAADNYVEQMNKSLDDMRLVGKIGAEREKIELENAERGSKRLALQSAKYADPAYMRKLSKLPASLPCYK
jgi:hypothetical protein